MGLICLLLNLIYLALLAWIILSYIAAYGRLPWGHPIRRIYDFLNGLMEPILRPIRRVLPPLRVGNMALDLSPLVVFLAVFLISRVLRC